MVFLNGITASYDDCQIIKGVSMRVKKGSFVGIVGKNGSGKTTLLRLISGIMNPDSGEIFITGKPLKTFARMELARVVACLVQNQDSGVPFSVEELVKLGRWPHRGNSNADHRAIVNEAMVRADVLQFAQRPFETLSGGEKQRALIASCLAQEPRILLLDEPTNHMDLCHQLSFMHLLKQLVAKINLTVVVILHDLNMAIEYCDEIHMLVDGRILGSGTPAEVITSESVSACFDTASMIIRNPCSGLPLVIPMRPEK